MKQNTIIDIAKRLGISKSTVSRVLSDHPDVKESTRIKVKKLAEELNFKPNLIAQSLKHNKNKIIGVIVPEVKHEFFSHAITGIGEVAYNAGYSIIVCHSNEIYEREIDNTNTLIQQRVAGIVASISKTTIQSDHFKNVIDQGIPLLFFDRVCEDISTSKVMIDDKKCAYTAVKHLIDRGYKKIAHFAGPESLNIYRKRVEGYEEALKKYGFKYSEDLVLYSGLDEKDGYNSMDQLFEKNIIPDAIFAANSPIALGAHMRIRKAGLKIPADIGIVGFADNEMAPLVNPPLTVINQPSLEMGKKAAKMLIKLINTDKNSIKHKTVKLNAELLVRGST
jgi:DNA-binding LacI/PurR family transcriptional regulator